MTIEDLLVLARVIALVESPSKLTEFQRNDEKELITSWKDLPVPRKSGNCRKGLTEFGELIDTRRKQQEMTFEEILKKQRKGSWIELGTSLQATASKPIKILKDTGKS